MADLRFLIDTLPPEISAPYVRLQQQAIDPPGGSIEAAELATLEAYALLEGSQPRGHRYHKGWPLHNLGMIRLLQQRLDEARELFLKAFVEDSLSRGEESPDKYDEVLRPAATNLVFAFGVAGQTLVDLARRLREAQAGDRLFRTPDDALEHQPLEPRMPDPAVEALRAVSTASPAREPEWRSFAGWGTPWEDRVFVGGSYIHHFGTLRLIRDTVRLSGHDGVLVAEFKASSATTVRNKSLTLLKGCRRAIFELSAAGGHLVEFDKLLDFETESVLVVYSKSTEKPAQISAMTRSLFGRLDVTERGYADPSDLQSIVATWLVT